MIWELMYVSKRLHLSYNKVSYPNYHALDFKVPLGPVEWNKKGEGMENCVFFFIFIEMRYACWVL